MFDTSIVRAHATAAPRRATFFASIVIHSIAVVAALALSVSATQVPPQPPRQMELYRPAELPAPPPPPPAGPPRVRDRQPERVVQPPVTHEITAPMVIPDQTPVAVESQALTASSGDATTTDQAGEPGGKRGGTPGGVPDGTGDRLGGTGTAKPVYNPGALGVSRAKVIRRVEPRFPSRFAGSVTEATVVVSCVIGSDGQIRDLQIVKSSFPPFNESVIEALRQWQFEPGRLHGTPVDTYFELSVTFRVTR
jgi:TonB family protein